MRLIAALLIASTASAAPPDWTRVDKAALDLLQKYIRIQSINPPADTRQAADFVKGVLEAAGIAVKLTDSGG